MADENLPKLSGVSQGNSPSRAVGGDPREVPRSAGGGLPERPVRLGAAVGAMGQGRPPEATTLPAAGTRQAPRPPVRETATPGKPVPSPAASAPRSESPRPAQPAGVRAQQPPRPDGSPKEVLQRLPEAEAHAFTELRSQANAAAAELNPELENAVGFTHFDTASSQDNLITVLMTRADLHKLPSQTLVRVKSLEDKRSYLGVVVRGPFSEPDAVAANSNIAVGVVVQGKKLSFTFDYHGRAEIEILGEENDGKVLPPGHRPRPKSPVFLLDDEESEHVLGMKGELCLGMVVGYKQMEARIDALDKSILPRHTGIIGTTGGGKSTTVATLIHRAQSAGVATIVFDVEGEYTHVDQATDEPTMLAALQRRKQRPEGVKDLHIHHLIGRDTRNRRHKHRHPFALSFSSLSPHAIAEILEMTDAQQERFHKAYEVTKLLLEDLKIFPKTPEEQQQLMELDELSTGYPRMTLEHLLDVVSTYIYVLSSEGRAESKTKTKGSSRQAPVPGENIEEGAVESAPSQGPRLFSEFKEHLHLVFRRVHEQSSRSEVSWKALFGRLLRLRRLKIFDVGHARGVDYDSMLTPGRVSVIDLSDTDSPQLNNLVIADILRGLQERQEERYQRAQEQNHPVDPALIIIEEAHEFLSASRIAQMPVLFEQVARIAKRGRKRWLGLVFVTQLPQHLPNEVLGLLNNFIIHKMTDSTVISRMQKSVGGIDESLWGRVPRLAPGQAIASFSSFKRPLMITVDPAPVKRLLVD
ncbi:ATP-binding protein [Hyalangium minutum]|uniref:ATP-binding protein n=1 Tax=Hyalangium minutum TaxID=394096 RepID=UPI0012FA9BA9